MGLEIDITEKEVLNMYGYQSLDKVKPEIRNTATEMINKGKELADFRSITCSLGSIKVKEKEDLIVLNSDYKLESTYLTDKLCGASRATAGLATVGFQIEKECNDYFNKGAYLKASLLDIVGNRLLDRITKKVWHTVRKESLTQGLGVSGYYSPGEGDWVITDQQFLFDLVSGEEIGVQLTSNQALSPQKSLLFIIGQGSNLDVDEYEPCLDCTNQDCPFQTNQE